MEHHRKREAKIGKLREPVCANFFPHSLLILAERGVFTVQLAFHPNFRNFYFFIFKRVYTLVCAKFSETKNLLVLIIYIFCMSAKVWMESAFVLYCTQLGIARSFLSSTVRWDKLGTEHLGNGNNIT